MTAVTAVRPRARKAKFRTWEETVNEPAIKALVGAYHKVQKNRNAGEMDLAKKIHDVRRLIGATLTHDALVGYLEVSDEKAGRLMRHADLWESIPDEDLWQAIGFRGVERINMIDKREPRQQIIDAVKERSATTKKTRGVVDVSLRYIAHQMSQRGVFNVRSPKEKPVDQPKTKTQCVITIDAAKRVLKEVRGLLVRDPTLQGYLSPEALALIEKV